MAGHISYPRTDNTVYPSSLDLRESLDFLAKGEFAREAGELLARPALQPSRGDKRTTDHPPIYPTGGPRRSELGDREWRLYELVARRFMATLADEAVIESNRIDLTVSGEPFFARGSRIVYSGMDRLLLLRSPEGSRTASAARGRPGGAGGQAVRGQGDAATVAVRPRYAHRAHGEAQSGHQGHAARHHPEPVRPRAMCTATRWSRPPWASRWPRPCRSSLRASPPPR